MTGELLALFVKHRDGDAFTVLLNRHGTMVLNVCRRVLGNSYNVTRMPSRPLFSSSLAKPGQSTPLVIQ